jgi:hypothetical protein
VWAQSYSGRFGEETNSLSLLLIEPPLWISKSKRRICVQTDFGPHPTSVNGLREFFVWYAKLKILPYSAVVKNTWSCASPPHMCFRGMRKSILNWIEVLLLFQRMHLMIITCIRWNNKIFFITVDARCKHENLKMESDIQIIFKKYNYG